MHDLENAPAISFSGMNQNNTPISLSDYEGKHVILFFYPKDNTPGCTTEAKAFSELRPEFEKRNTVVIGVSKDSVKSHQNFYETHQLSVDLISDPDLEIINAYGVWQSKTNYGKQYMGVVRTTVLIDSSMRISKVWSNVRVKGHAESVLDHVKQLSGGV